jgi:DNA-binding XRE family transcriptional regulator
MPRTLRRPYASIKAWRDATGTKQEALAKRIGISQQHLANIECGTRTCSLEVAKKLSKLTNVPIESIGDISDSVGG